MSTWASYLSDDDCNIKNVYHDYIKMTLVFIQNMENQNYTNFRQKQNLKILMHNEICFCSTNFVHKYMLRFLVL